MDDGAVKLRSFREGRDVLLKWGDFEAFGTIRWRRQEVFGLRFDPSIAPFILRATRAQEDEISIRVT